MLYDISNVRILYMRKCYTSNDNFNFSFKFGHSIGVLLAKSKDIKSTATPWPRLLLTSSYTVKGNYICLAKSIVQLTKLVQTQYCNLKIIPVSSDLLPPYSFPITVFTHCTALDVRYNKKKKINIGHSKKMLTKITKPSNWVQRTQL